LQNGAEPNRRRRAAGEPTYISVSDVCTLTAKHFAGLVETASSSTDNISHRSSSSSSSSTLADLESFLAALPALPAWEQLWKDAKKESERLVALLPSDLQQAAEAASAEDQDDDGSESNS